MIIVAGTFRLTPENVTLALGMAQRVVEATRAEDGCILYAYAQDLFDPGLIHVAEKWRDRASLAAHGKSAHMQQWITERAVLNLTERDIRMFETDEGVAL